MQDAFGADEIMAPLSGDEEIHAEVPAACPPQPTRGIPTVHSGGEPVDPNFVVDEPGARLHMSKRVRLVPPTSHAPTVKEIHLYKAREYLSIRKKRKYGTPAPETKPPRVGTHVGLFSHAHQEYMFIFRSSLTADVVMLAPWADREGDMVERAIVRSDAATGLHREDVITGQFQATVSLFV